MSVPRIPLTASQRDIWIASSHFPSLPQYNSVAYDRITGDVDVDLLRSCASRAARRAETFQLRFGEDDGLPYQWLEPEPPDVPVIDVDSAEAWMRAEFTRPFTLTDSRMYDLAVLRESPTAACLYVKAHHLVADGWALHQFLTEVFADYEHVVRTGEPLDIRTPSYVDHVCAEARYRASARHSADREFHRNAIADVTPALFARRAPAGARRTAHHRFVLDRDLIARIRAGGTSPFAYVAATFAAYLARAHDTSEVVLGVPSLNRHTMAEKLTIGHFANTHPLRVAAGDKSIPALAGEVQAGVYALLRHDRISLGDVLRELPADGPRQLFDVTISYMRYPARADIPGIARETAGMAPAHDQDALAVLLTEFEDVGHVVVDLDYACDVFDDDLPIEAVAGHLQALLRGGLDQPAWPWPALPMVRDEDRAILMGPVTEVPATTVHGLFEEQAARTPDRPAVDSLTYAELDARANQVAHGLRARGVGADDRVAVVMERGPDLLVVLLGVLKAGGAYVPIDPRYPAERIRFLIADSGARVVLDALPPLAQSSAPVPPVAGPGNLAYVIYTSGSTGRPKGTLVEHRSVVNRLRWMQRRYPLGADDVLVQKTPMSFDVSVWELFWWALAGARLTLPPPGAEKDPAALLADRPTVIHFVPSMFGPFLDAVAGKPRLAESLRYVFCSGEALSPALVNRFNRLVLGTRLVNLYGPTEATVDVSYFDCPASFVERVPIGRPIDNLRLYVLDRHDRPLPAGLVGELCIAGIGVARGYLDRPELTAFTADPFHPGERMYRTGDRVRLLADGNLEYLGRSDGQVKIRGNRVELGEVRDHLSTCPGVRGAVVIARPTTHGRQLVGYYRADEQLDPAKLRAYLADRLPEFMIPAHFVALREFPLTPNGKVDQRALPAPVTEWTSEAPRDEVESVLAAVWAEVLGAPVVGVHDNYFTLGGDSILMLSIRAKAAKQGVHFGLADLVQHPTVAGLARTATTTAAPDPTVPPFSLVSAVDRLRLADAVDAYPVSRLQLGLLYHSRERETSAVYHDVFRYTFELPWDEEALRRSFAALVARHPALRSSFDLAGGTEPLQVVHPAIEGGLLVVDLRDRPAEPVIRAHQEERRFHHYDFGTAPLYLLAAFPTGSRTDSTVDLVFSFHHAVLDGWSVASLMSDLLEGYLGAAPGAPPPSPAGHVLAERQAMGNEATRRYWSDILAGAAPSRLDGFRQYAPPGDEGLVVRRRDLPAELVEEVRRFARSRQLPAKSVLFAAHCLTLRLYAGDITTGLVTHGRPAQADAEQMAGLFLNTLPVRVNTKPNTWLEVVDEVYRQERDGHPHRWYPLSAMQEDHGAAVLDTAFNYMHPHVLAPVLRGSGLRLLAFEAWEETNFALLVNAVVDPVTDAVWLRVDGDGRVFTEARVDQLAASYVDILSRLVSHPTERIDFTFLAKPAPPAVTTEPENVVTGVDRAAAATPDAVAIVSGSERWTYERLTGTATRIAARLRALGVTPGDRVGLAMSRSPEQLATVLALAKSGATCVPLDLGYPTRRLAMMVDHCQPRHIITSTDEVPEFAPPGTVLPYRTLVDTAADHPAPAETPPDIPLYIIFTSGSTGRPAGIPMPRRAFANLVAWQKRAASAALGGVTLQYSPMSFDVSYQEIFSTLGGGGTLVVVSEEDRRDMRAVLRLIDRHSIERIFLPYVALQQLAETADALGVRPRSLRVVVSSGEQLRVTGEIRRFCAGRLLENQYGPSEAHVVTSFPMTERFPALPPVGTAIDGAEVTVLDDDLRPVPPGVVGEIHVAGICLAAGYDGDPELTARRFVTDRDGTRRYRTGDLGVVLPDGQLASLGRKDGQVKIRGFRVEPAEVELAIMDSAPGLTEVAVVARDSATLVAFLVGAADLTELRAELRSRLPEHLVPSHFTWLPSLPVAPTGKRDDAALRQLPVGVGTASAPTAPRDRYERTLAGILAELLRVPVGVHDDIFELGATSLTAMRLVVTIEKRYGVHLPLAALVAAPTVAELADRLRAGGASTSFDPLVPIRPLETGQPLFLVHPIGGNVLCYLPLARHLPADLPCYALQAAGGEPGTTPLDTVEELAASYLAAVRRVQPDGPYRLAGWSFGGFVVFEMARQLRRAGATVEVVLLDTVALGDGPRAGAGEDTLLAWFFWELLLPEHGGSAPVEAPSGADPFDLIAEAAARAGILPADSAGGYVRRLFEVFRANWRAALAYRPAVVDQNLTLVRASEPLPVPLESVHGAAGSRHTDPHNGWAERTTGRVEVIDVPGDHLTIMTEPHVRAVAEQLTTHLTTSRESATPNRNAA